MSRYQIFIAVLALIASSATSTAQTVYPDSAIRQRMQTEEREFLSSMKPGLQHTQMLAVRKAMQGDDSDLQQIRASRNQVQVLPEAVNAYYPTPDICLFTPKNKAKHKRPILLYLHGGGWCFGSINSCARHKSVYVSMIGYAEQKDSNVYVYNTNGAFIWNRMGTLLGYTSTTVTIKHGSVTYICSERGEIKFTR